MARQKEYRKKSRFPGSRTAEYQNDRDARINYSREYRDRNREEIRRKAREYVAANAELVAERKHLTYLKHREKYLARYREWAAANPEEVRAILARNRARRLGAPGRFTKDDVIILYDKQRGLCFYCTRSLAEHKFHVDHYVPLVRGGTNYPDNLVLACPRCNRAKCAKLPEHFKPPKE